MENSKINNYQLFCLYILFNFGTALVVPLGLNAKQGAPLAILLGLLGGFILLQIYLYLFSQFPDKPLTVYLEKVLGKYLGKVTALLYILFFIYGAARDLRDMGELLSVSVYKNTPIIVINLLMLLTITYVIYLGIEVLVRTGEILFAIIIVIGVIGVFFVIISEIINLNNLLPITGEGLDKILSTAYPRMTMFPFGETITFTMLFPYINQPKKTTKTSYLAMLVSGILLSLTITMEIAVLGVDIASRSTFPLLETIRKVNVLNFFQRLDVIVILSLIICNFFKISVFFYVALIGAIQLFNFKKHYDLITPLAIIILISSIIIASSYTEHIEQGNLALETTFIMFSLVIPLMLMLITMIKHKFSKS